MANEGIGPNPDDLNMSNEGQPVMGEQVIENEVPYEEPVGEGVGETDVIENTEPEYVADDEPTDAPQQVKKSGGWLGGLFSGKGVIKPRGTLFGGFKQGSETSEKQESDQEDGDIAEEVGGAEADTREVARRQELLELKAQLDKKYEILGMRDRAKRLVMVEQIVGKVAETNLAYVNGILEGEMDDTRPIVGRIPAASVATQEAMNVLNDAAAEAVADPKPVKDEYKTIAELEQQVRWQRYFDKESDERLIDVVRSTTVATHKFRRKDFMHEENGEVIAKAPRGFYDNMRLGLNIEMKKMGESAIAAANEKVKKDINWGDEIDGVGSVYQIFNKVTETVTSGRKAKETRAQTMLRVMQIYFGEDEGSDMNDEFRKLEKSIETGSDRDRAVTDLKVIEWLKKINVQLLNAGKPLVEAEGLSNYLATTSFQIEDWIDKEDRRAKAIEDERLKNLKRGGGQGQQQGGGGPSRPGGQPGGQQGPQRPQGGPRPEGQQPSYVPAAVEDLKRGQRPER